MIKASDDNMISGSHHLENSVVPLESSTLIGLTLSNIEVTTVRYVEPVHEVAQATMELRWRGGVLQQKWILNTWRGFQSSSRTEWRDVPRVADDAE